MGGNEKVTIEDNQDLIKPFSKNEIKEALFQMGKNKVVGPDNVPVEFYQTCWEIIKKDIIEMFDDLHQGKLEVNRINDGTITLLAKVPDAKSIQ
jgi:2-iminoacetate synthase ThiH